MEILKDKEFEKKVLLAKKPVLLEFSSPGCIVCKLMKDRITKIERVYSDRVDFYRVEIEGSDLTAKYQVKTIPTILYFKEGVLVSREDTFPNEGEIEERLAILLHERKNPRYFNLVKEMNELRTKFLNQLDQKIGHEKKVLRDYIGQIDKFIETLPKAKMSIFSVIPEIKDAIDAEYIVRKFYAHISKSAKNGRVRVTFAKFAAESRRHQEMLSKRLKELTGESYQVDMSKFSSTGLVPSSFSFMGMIETAINTEERAYEFYQRMQKVADDDKDKNLFGLLVREERGHRRLLARELRFLKDKEFLKPKGTEDFFGIFRKLWQ